MIHKVTLIQWFTDNFFVIKLLIWDGYFTVKVAPLGSINQIDHVLYCRATPVYSEKINLEVPAFLLRPTFILWQRKSAKCSLLLTGHCFGHSPLTFVTEAFS